MLTANQIVDRFSDPKTLPQVAIRITQLANSQTATIHEFEEIIRLDPVLVTRLLRLVNSSYYGLVNKVDSISKAVVYIGMKQLRNLAAVEAVKTIFSGSSDDLIFSRKNLWLHSATVAILADMIARRIFGVDGGDFFLAGIMHDIGLIAEDQVAGDLLRQACKLYDPGVKTLVDSEQELIGTDHGEVGALLAKGWKLPPDVVRAIRLHHDTGKKHPVPSQTSVIQLAEYIAGKMRYTPLPGKMDPLPPHLAKHIRQMMADYKVIAGDLPAEMEKAKDLYE